MDDKYPDNVSTFVVDPKQIRAVVANDLGFDGQSIPTNDPEFECAVERFLVNLGERLLHEDQKMSPTTSKTPMSSINKPSETILECPRGLRTVTLPKVHRVARPKLYKDARASVPSHKIKPSRLKHTSHPDEPTPAAEDDTKQKPEPTIGYKEFKWEVPRLQRGRINPRTSSNSEEQRLQQEHWPKRKQALVKASREDRATAQVVIVGAGLAGLRAADELLRLGFKYVTVLEASGRVGGRIHSVVLEHDEKNVLADLGVRGIDCPHPKNTAYNLASDHGLCSTGVTEQRSPEDILRKHRFVAERVLPNVLTSASRTVKSMKWDLDLIHNTIANESTPVRLTYTDFIRERRRRIIDDFRRIGLPCIDNDYQTLSNAVKGLAHTSQTHFGDNEGNFGAHHLGRRQEVSPAETVLRLPGGMGSLLEPLMERFSKKTLKLKAKVESVDWSRFTLKNIRDGEKPIVTITCRDGRTFKADHVIITVPLGHLKKNAKTMFIPSLPAEKQKAIDSLGFGTVSNIFLLFDEPLTHQPFSFIWVGHGKLPTASLSSRTVQVRTNPFTSSLVEVAINGSMPEDISEAILVKDVKQLLEDFLQRNIPDPKKVLRSRWHRNSLFEGTHPYLKVDNTGDEMTVLSQPVMFLDQPVLQFAGDGTQRESACLLHAALASGAREAQRLYCHYDRLFGYENTLS